MCGREVHWLLASAILTTAIIVGSNTDGSELEPTGWLLLNGELVTGPYAIAIVEGTIEINGLDIYGHRVAEPDVNVDVDPKIVAQHQMLNRFWKSFDTWVEEQGIERARARAVEFMREQPLVKNAYLASESDLRILLYDEEWEESVILEPPDPDQSSPEEVRREYLEGQVEAFEYWLTRGSLVVLQGGLLMATPPSEGETTLEQLEEIVASEADVRARIDAILEVIPDRDMAATIAERFVGR